MAGDLLLQKPGPNASSDTIYSYIRTQVAAFYQKHGMLPGRMPITFQTRELVLRWHIDWNRDVHMKGTSIMLFDTELYLVSQIDDTTAWRPDSDAVPTGKGF